jgi:hypothetical protein
MELYPFYLLGGYFAFMGTFLGMKYLTLLHLIHQELRKLNGEKPWEL